MKKLQLILSIVLLTSVNLFAQTGEKKIDELYSLLDAEEYGKAVSKGLKLIGSDDYRKHPYSYLYTAMAYYGMYENPTKHDAGTKDSKYPAPLKSAQKYLTKFNSVEKKAEKYFPEYESNYDEISDFQFNIAKATNEKAQSYFLDNKASKAVGVYKNGLKALQKEPVLLLWQGVSEVTMKNTVEGDKNINLALDTINESFNPSDATKNVLSKGLLLAADYFENNGFSQKASNAKKLAELFKKYDNYDEIKDDLENPELPDNVPAEKKIDDLLFLYVDGKYDKTVNKGLGLMQDATYSKHPSSFLYTAMSYYEMSRLPGQFDVGEKGSKYPKPLKEAQKYLAKFIKVKTKVKKYFPYYRQDNDEVNDFFEAIADTTNKVGQHFYLTEDFRKAAGFYKVGVKSVPNDPILLLWQGVCEIKGKNTTEGSKHTLDALAKMDEKFEPSEGTRGVLAHGLLIAEEYFRTNGNTEAANKSKKLVEVFKKYDPDELNKQKMEERKAKAKKDDKVMRQFFSDEDEKQDPVFEEAEKSADDELDAIEREAAKDE